MSGGIVNMNPCAGSSVLSENGHAREYPRKPDFPIKEVWDFPKYLHIL